MKKLVLIPFVGIFCSSISAQYKSDKGIKQYVVGISHASIGRSGISASLSSAFKHTPWGMFGGFEAGGFLFGTKQFKDYYPFSHKYKTIDNVYVGPAYITSRFVVGVGIEGDLLTINDRARDLRDVRAVAGRIYTRALIGKNTLLFSCNIGSPFFHYVGYWRRPINEYSTTEVGIYANSATSGIGPMIRWGKTISKQGNKSEPVYTASIGFNPFGYMGASLMITK